jgi:hypothetical protein
VTGAVETAGVVSLLVLALPAVMLVAWSLRHTAKTRASAAELERENEELRGSNADLRDLFELAAGLAAQPPEVEKVTASARGFLERLAGARVEVVGGVPQSESFTPLSSHGRVVGGLHVEGGGCERWSRLRESIEPLLAAALEGAMLAAAARETHLETIAALSRSMEARDDYTGGHTARVSVIAVGLARRLGYTGSDLEAIEIGALIHDIGKVGIPESILHKPGPLDNDEWIVMKRHPVISELILGKVELSPLVLQIVRSSHERIDGQGYPDGLAGEEIPLPARIVFVADAFDALTSDRPYRRARRPKAALEEIAAGSGAQFCPKVVAALKQMYVEEPAVMGEVVLSVVAS